MAAAVDRGPAAYRAVQGVGRDRLGVERRMDWLRAWRSARASARDNPSPRTSPARRLSLVFEYGRLRGPVEAQHAVSYDVVSTMRICVPSGSVAWVQTWWPRRLRVHASVCLELRGAPLATAREVWGLRSAAWWASVDLTYHVVRPTTLSVRDQRRAAPCTPITCLFCRSSNRS